MTLRVDALMQEKILEAAASLWGEKGYQSTTMREIARRLGMGVNSLYSQFRSKEEIVQFLYVRLNDRALEAFRTEYGENKNLGECLKGYLQIKLALIEPYRTCMPAIVREAVDPASPLNPLSPDSSGVLQRNLDFFELLVARAGAARGERARALSRSLWLMHLGAIFYWMHDRSPGYSNTQLMLDKIGDMLGFIPMLGRMPGMESTLRLLSELFERAPVPAEKAPSVRVEAPMRQVDVVVIGGGPIGTLYASFLKLQRPRTRVLVLEKATEPGHKIGESTLSGFCKALRAVGIRRDVLQQLFYPKNGLGFFRIDESVRDLRNAPEYILEAFDETYQVERRVLDSLLLANARRLGVEIIQGAAVQVKQCTFSAKGNTVVYEIGSHQGCVRSSLVVDASGPSGVLARDAGLWTSEGLPFQTSAVWTYFSDVPPLASYEGWPNHAQYPRDQYTQHLCFREGWMWYIPLYSFQSAPSANLGRALERMLRADKPLLRREKMAEEYGCPSADILSVGITVRSDRDSAFKEDGGAVFEHYARKYPAIRQVLHDGRQLKDVYGSGPPFMQRMQFRGHARRVVGDGWMLVGDAAFFVDPLISPGLTGGTAQAFYAATESVKALDAGIYTGEFLGAYEGFVHRLHDALERDNQLVYMSFNHPEAAALIQRFQEIDSRKQFHEQESQEYTLVDTNVWGILKPSYQELQRAAWSIMREEEIAVEQDLSIDEQSPLDYDRMVRRLRQVLGEYVDSQVELTPYAVANAGVQETVC